MGFPEEKDPETTVKERLKQSCDDIQTSVVGNRTVCGNVESLGVLEDLDDLKTEMRKIQDALVRQDKKADILQIQFAGFQSSIERRLSSKEAILLRKYLIEPRNKTRPDGLKL